MATFREQLNASKSRSSFHTPKRPSVHSISSTFIQNFFQNKTLQKRINDPLFKEVDNLKKVQLNGKNSILSDFFGECKEVDSQKIRETVFFIKKLDLAKFFIKKLVKDYKAINDNFLLNEDRIRQQENFCLTWNENREIILKIISIINPIGQKSKDRNILKQMFDEILGLNQNSRFLHLNMVVLVFFGRISEIFKDFIKSVFLYKQAKYLATNSKQYKFLIKCYKGLGRCFQNLKKYETAKHYFIKVLQISWLIMDRKNELYAYDSIGLQYYYLGMMEDAQFFHSKMVFGHFEENDSAIKNLGIAQLQKTKKDNETYIKGIIENKQPKKKRTLDENPIFNISSSDDEFDFSVPISSEKSHHESNNKLKQFNLTNSNAFFAGNIKKNNDNIRSSSLPKVEKKKIINLGYSMNKKNVSNAFLQSNPFLNKKKIVTHLTPNKSSEYFYHVMGNKKDDFSEKCFSQLDFRTSKLISRKLKILVSNLEFTVKKIDVLLSKVFF